MFESSRKSWCSSSKVFFIVLISLSSFLASASFADTKTEKNTVSKPLVKVLLKLNEGPKNPEDEAKKRPLLIKTLNQYVELPDARLEVALNMRKVLLGHMTSEAFFKKLATMTLNEEPRFFLMRVKKDIANKAGVIGLEYFLGKQYKPGGGSYVEKELLTWRRNLVEEGIKKVVRDFKGKQRIGDYDYHVYRVDIGSWAKETPDQMKFSGDIDFNFVCANSSLILQMKAAFNDFIKIRVGMSAESFDTVCSAHGMAHPEVYVGEHGRVFAERLMKEGYLRRILLEQGVVSDTYVPGAEALKVIYYDAKVRKSPMTLPLNKMPTEPGITMEMIRHFTNDIKEKSVYTPLDQFIKAAKYTKRSYVAFHEAGFILQRGEEGLNHFVQEFMKEKEAGSDKQVEVIKKYFGDLPSTVELKTSAEGHHEVTIRANEEFVQEFFKKCQRAMWDNVNRAFEVQIEDLKSKIAQTTTKVGAMEVRAELAALKVMMEIEFMLFKDPKIGTDIDPRTEALMREFRDIYADFMIKMGPSFLLTDEEMKVYKFLKEMLKPGAQDSQIKLAMATIARSSQKIIVGGETVVLNINKILDIPDEIIMGRLRGGPASFQDLMDDIRGKPVRESWSKMTTEKLPETLKSSGAQPKKVLAELSKTFNDKLYNSCAARGIKNVNMVLGESIQSSAVGRTAMKGVITVNLATELPAYWNAFWEGKDLGDSFAKVGVEYIRRRVPFGSVTEHVIMGNYAMAAWDTCVNIVPPLALASLAATISYELSGQTWRLFWSEELDKFVAGLYENAEFKLDEKKTVHISDSLDLKNYRLLSVKYRNLPYSLREFEVKKREQIDKMKAALSKPHKDLPFPLEYKYEGLTGWYEVDKILKENLVKTDNVLMMIDEMKENEYVGKKLLDRIQNDWQTRWEQVKLNFTVNLITILEKRWQAEQVLKDNQREKVLEELIKLAKKLEIQKEVQEGLRAEMGSWVYQWAKWGFDYYLKGTKRELLVEPAVWDEWKEGTRILIYYLETYHKILKAREESEKVFSPSRSVTDRGLRNLTGPYLLSGRAENDEHSYRQWKDLPETVNQSLVPELAAIKVKYGFSWELNEPFDLMIKDKVQWHDVWQELWKHVGSLGKLHAPEYWHELELNVVEGELSQARLDQFPSIRVAYHLDNRNSAVEAFDLHYRYLAAMEVEERMRKACAAAEAKLTQADTKLSALEGQSKTLAQENMTRKATIERLSKVVPDVETRAKTADKLYLSIGEGQKDLEKDVLNVCVRAKKIVDGDFTVDLSAAMAEIEDTMKTIGKKKAQLGEYFANLKPEVDEIEQIYSANLTTPTGPEKAPAVDSDQASADSFSAVRSLIAEALAIVNGFRSVTVQPEVMKEVRPTCLNELEKKIKAMNQSVDDAEKRLNANSTEQATLQDREKELLKRLERGAKDAAASQDSAEVIIKHVDELVKGQATQCTFRALRARDQIIAKLIEKISQDIKSCRFAMAEIEIMKMPAGDLRTKAEAELDGARKKEAKYSQTVQELKGLVGDCKFDEAQTKIDNLLNSATCGKAREGAQTLHKEIKTSRAHEAKTRTKFKEANTAFGQCKFDEALKKLNEASKHTRCQRIRERLAGTIATVTKTKSYEAITKQLFNEANSAYQRCELKLAMKKLNEARERTKCERYAQSLEKKISTVKQRISYENRNMSLYEEAQKNVADCELNAALDRLNRALNGSQCEDNRRKIKQKIAMIKKAEPNLAKVKSLYAEAKTEYGQCNYDNALSKMQTALNYTSCGRYRESLAQKIETTETAKSYEARTLSLFSEANSSYKRCDYALALQKLKLALDHTHCSRYKNSLREKITKVQTAKRDNENAEILFQRGERLVSQGNNNQAVTKLREAHEKARCQNTRQKINTKLSSIRSSVLATKREKEKKRTSTRLSTQIAVEFDWGQRLPYPAYIYHVTKTHTYSGSFDRDMYLCHKAANPDANGQIHDRLGHYQASRVAGPLTTPRAICEAYRGLDPAKGRAPGGWAGVNFNCGAYSPK